MPAAQEDPAPNGQKQGKPEQTQLQKSVAVARRVVQTQKTAEDLKQRAKNAVNPKERIRLLKEAYSKEVEAHGQSKYAKRLQSGTWQGATAGGGIGGGVALGTGAAVGTLVTGLVSIPTVLVGGLVGAGVGGIHGPWITFGGGSKKEEPPMSEEEIHAQAVKEAERLDQAVEKGANTVPVPPELDEGENGAQAAEGEERPPGPSRQNSAPSGLEGTPEKRKPKKLQVRSGNEVQTTPERKKPRKLEVRSVAERKENE